MDTSTDKETIKIISDLGQLSEKYEAGKRGAGAFNGCSASDPGGCSYGKYQIAADTGTMNIFIKHLKENNPDMYAILEDAGGNSAAKKGSKEFVKAWKKLAGNPEFGNAQHEFIKKTHYQPLVDKITKGFPDFNLEKFAPVIKDVLWSISVHHGYAYSRIMKKVLKLENTNNMTDKQMINAIYDERAIYIDGLKFKNITNLHVKNRYKRKMIQRRTIEERNSALNRLSQQEL